MRRENKVAVATLQIAQVPEKKTNEDEGKVSKGKGQIFKVWEGRGTRTERGK